MKRLVLLAALCSLPLSAHASSDSRDFSLDVPADGLERLELDVNVGEAEIHAADIDVIEIRVRLDADEDSWFGASEDVARQIAEAQLRHDVSGGVLSLDLDYEESRRGSNDLEEHWEIRLPARLVIEAELNVGSMKIKGTSGGVTAEVNVGELHIEVTEGDVDAEVNVGDLAVRTATPSPGRFDLESNIGESSLRIDGKAAGRSEGWLGNNVQHDADGDDDVTARVNVGQVSVKVR